MLGEQMCTPQFNKLWKATPLKWQLFFHDWCWLEKSFNVHLSKFLSWLICWYLQLLMWWYKQMLFNTAGPTVMGAAKQTSVILIKKSIICLSQSFCEQPWSDVMLHTTWVCRQQVRVKLKEVGHITKKLEVCSLLPKALYLAANCGCSFLFHYSLQYFKLICCQKMLKMNAVLFCWCIFDDR